jgi:hypothetical protein
MLLAGRKAAISSTSTQMIAVATKMLSEYLFVSCDIVAHSTEPNVEIQVARVEGLNFAIGELLYKHADENLIWASGGDGGHVAIPCGPRAPHIALDLIRKLREWSTDHKVPLRVCGSVGYAKEVPGADGRTQLVGPGINTAGMFIHYGGARRVVVMDAFRDIVKQEVRDMYQFHHRVRLEPKNSLPITAWLLSSDGQFDSSWQEPKSTTDSSLLAVAVSKGDALEVIYRSRRLLELNSTDARAIQALRSLGDMAFKGKRNFLHKLLQDEHIGAELIGLGNLLERRAGETLCSSGEGATSMFLILHGRLQVFFEFSAGLGDDSQRLDSVVMEPGDLGGELAFALRRNRTATLQCLEDVALLSFTYEELLKSFAGSTDIAGVHRALTTEILAKVLENLCNTASFFRPVWSVLSEQSKQAPWTFLLTKSELVPISADKLWIDFPLTPLTEEIVILVGGSLRAEMQGRIYTGEEYPILYAHLLPGVPPLRTRMSVREDCQVIRIKREGLLRLGPVAFELISKQANVGAITLKQPESAQALAHLQLSKDLVFISYCRENREEVASLRDRLISAGELVWWDQDILPGADWKFEIRCALRRSYAIICCFSSELETRSKSGVYPELSEAVRAVRERPPGDIFLIPVRLSKCVIPPVEIDDVRTLDRLQTLDLFPLEEFDTSFEKLLAALWEARW